MKIAILILLTVVFGLRACDNLAGLFIAAAKDVSTAKFSYVAHTLALFGWLLLIPGIWIWL